MRIDMMRPDDWPAVRDIYEAGIETGEASRAEATPCLDYDARAARTGDGRSCVFRAVVHHDRVVPVGQALDDRGDRTSLVERGQHDIGHVRQT